MLELSKFIAGNSIKGFLAEDEGEALYDFASEVATLGPCLEIGSYCGKSTLYIGKACRKTHNTLYAVDHHRGSEEHQRGEQYHDPALYDAEEACVDSFPTFRRTLALAGLEQTVVPVVAPSAVVVRHWATPLGLVFIDGGHSHETAMHDCCSWAQKLAAGGLLAVHDLFADPKAGGQGPILAFNKVLDSGCFTYIKQVNSLGILRKK